MTDTGTISPPQTTNNSIPTSQRPRRTRPDGSATFTVRGTILTLSQPRTTRKGTASTTITVGFDDDRKLPLTLYDHDLTALQERIHRHSLTPGATIRVQGVFRPARNRQETDIFIIDRDELFVLHTTSSASSNGSERTHVTNTAHPT